MIPQPEIDLRKGLADETKRSTFRLICRAGAVFAGALLMAWPAFYNRHPLLYPDSMSYFEDGPLVARAVFLHRFSADYGGRSFIYCLGILPFHWNVTPWPIVGLNALVTAYVIWLVVRSILPRRTVTHYFAVVAPLSLLTGLGWFVSLIMPDIYGPVLYLSIYLLVFAPETLTPAERAIVALITWWSVASHVTHLMLAFGLCVTLALLALIGHRATRQRFRAIGKVAILVVVAAGAHIAVHMYLYGQPSLSGKRAPFLLARVIVDGPGRQFLRQHCEHTKLVVCNYLDEIPDDANAFLWNLDGVWQTASPATKDQLRDEETRVVWGTLRSYPRQELFISLAHFGAQLTTFGLWDYGPNAWVLREFDKVMPDDRSSYLRSRQARNALPAELASSVEDWTVAASLFFTALFSVSIWRRRPKRLLGLITVVVFVILANAFVTGVLANVEDRYQSRVIWLLPLLAALFVFEWIDCKSCTSRGHA